MRFYFNESKLQIFIREYIVRKFLFVYHLRIYFSCIVIGCALMMSKSAVRVKGANFGVIGYIDAKMALT